MSDDNGQSPHSLGDVLELGHRSFIFDGDVWQPSASPSGQALIRQLGEPRGNVQPVLAASHSSYSQNWPVQVVVQPPDYERQAKTFITVWLKYVLLVVGVVGTVVIVLMLISGGVLAALMGALFGR